MNEAPLTFARRARILGILVAGAAALLAAGCAPDNGSPPLADGVARAAGYEEPLAEYIVANPTNIYSNHSMSDSQVTGRLERGEHVEALAKVQGYEWVLVGRDGTGIGYVPISMLSPAELYVP